MWGVLLVLAIFAALILVSAARRLEQEARPEPHGQPPKKVPPTHNRAAPPSISVARPSNGGQKGMALDVDLAHRAPPLPQKGLEWVPFEQGLHAQGFVIPTAGTFTSRNGSSPGGRATDPSEIVQSLHAAGSRTEPALEYWPWYQGLTPGQRWRYLSWLAGGRTSLPSEDGYLFIYYYGLERRALVDKADLDRIIVETLRLREMHITEGGAERSRSFRGYSEAFLWHLAAREPHRFSAETVESLAAQSARWDDENLAALFSWCVQRQRPLSPDLAFAVASSSPKSQRSVVARRVGQEFRALFSKRYSAAYGQGISLGLPPSGGSFTYRPASAALRPSTTSAPNPWPSTAQFDSLSDLWNTCVSDLQDLSRATLTVGGDDLTVERWQALPPELRHGIDHPLTKKAFDLVSQHASDAAECIVQMGKLAEVVGVEKRPRLTPTQSKRVAQVFHDIGYAVEPDARLTGQAYDWDEDVAVFLRTFDQDTDTTKYAGAAWTLRLGLAVALADGSASDEEVGRVTAAMNEMFDLNDADRRRLEALRSLLIRSASDLSGLGKRVQEALPESARVGLGRLLVAVAAADGVIYPKELTALRKCYRALGLSPDSLDGAIGELAPSSDEGLVVVPTGRAAPARPGEPVPPPPEEQPIRLDRVAIRRILAETEQVRRVLAEAMTTLQEPSETEPKPLATVAALLPPDAPSSAPTPLPAPVPTGLNPAPTAEPGIQHVVATPTALAALPPRFLPFFQEITARSSWSLDDAKAVAKRSKVMLDGAIEAINEASLDALGRALIFEEGDRLSVECPKDLVN